MLRFCDFINIFLCDPDGDDDDLRDRLIHALPLKHLRSVVGLHGVLAPAIRFELSSLVRGISAILSQCDHRFGAGMAKHPLLSAVCDVLDVGTNNADFVAELSRNDPEYLDGWIQQTLVARLYAHGVRALVTGRTLCHLHHRRKGLEPGAAPPTHWLRPFGLPICRRNQHLCALERTVGQAAHMFEFLEDVLQLDADGARWVVAGGSVRDALAYSPINDFDLFLVGGRGPRSPDTAMTMVHDALRVLLQDNLNIADYVMLVLTDHVITLCMYDPDESVCVVVQLVLRWFSSIEHMLCNFDLDPCKYAWDGRDFWAMDGAEHSRRTRTVIVDPAQHSTPARLLKYARKGYEILVPASREMAHIARLRLATLGHDLDSLRELEKRGGLLGALALGQRSFISGADVTSDHVITHVYGYLPHPPTLLNPAHRADFLARNPGHRVYSLSPTEKHDLSVDEAMERLFPKELRNLLLQDHSRWYLERPEIRRRCNKGVEHFYDLPPDRPAVDTPPPPDEQSVGTNKMSAYPASTHA